MLVTVKGIVVGRREVGESGCFLDVFTDRAGLIEVMAHGAKKIGGSNLAASSMFAYAEFCLSKKGTRYTINSTRPIYTFHDISKSIEAFSLAAYFADIIKYCSTSEEDHSELLRFVCMAFYQLEKGKRPINFIKAVFEFRFITHIGFMPDLRACQECACYLDDTMYFLPSEGMIFCSNCYTKLAFTRNKDAYELDPTLLHIMRYVAYSDTEKMFKFRISEKYEQRFGEITEAYIEAQLETSFNTLKYYKDVLAEY